MRRLSSVACGLLLCGVGVAQTAGGDAGMMFLPSQSPQGIVAERNFFVLTEVARHAEVRDALAGDAVLTKLRDAHAAALQKAIAECKTVACFDAALRWSDEDVAATAEEWKHLYATSRAVKQYADITLHGSGRYALYKAQGGAELLATAWTDAARGINRILSVYGDGDAPHYSKIDSMRYDAKSAFYFNIVRATAMMIEDESHKETEFFFPELKDAVMLLAANGRLDAARFAPLERTENAAAVAHAKTVNWAKFPYSVIVVPGEGPDIAEEEFSPLGRIRVELAVKLYRAGKAPFLLVSGGTVHPMLTKYCEAIEMKRELMEQWKVPASAIIVDPYARHTTTNLRNAVRQISEYGLSMKKPMLVTSDYGQIAMIMEPAFDERCMKEMHFKPYSTKDRLSATEISMQPDAVSLQMDANDPMDP